MSGSITKIGPSTKPQRGRIQVKIGDTGLQVPDRLRPSRRLRSALLTVFMALPGISANAGPVPEPNLSSLFPLGGRPGAQVQVTLRGGHLASARAVWFDSPGLDAEILSFEAKGEDKTESGPSPESGADRLALRISIDPNVEPGERRLRVVTPGGLSNSLPFRVHREPVQMESESAHELPDGAQALKPYPLAVHGRITRSGEVDDYSFHAAAGTSLRFQVVSSPALDPAITLYERSGGWFDPKGTRRIAFNDEDVFYPGSSTEPALSHRFDKGGTYFVRISSFMGTASPDHAYLLRVVPEQDREAPAGSAKGPQPTPADWEERSWTRRLETDRMKTLWTRAVPSLASRPEGESDSETAESALGAKPDPFAPVPVVSLSGRQSDGTEPARIALPTLLTGVIQRPGEIHRVRFTAQVGDRIVLEVETPDKTVPLFNPYLKLVDADGVEVLTNVHSILNSNSEIQKQIHPKTTHAFPRAGEFTLEIRDITATYGDAEMRYRVMVRPQVPHMGKVHIEDEVLNLEAGRAGRLSVITDQEEGFEGAIMLTMEGLPAGVETVTATETEPVTPPAINRGREERYVAQNKKATFVLVASPDAPETPRPVKVRVSARPVVEGLLGPATPVKELFVMVLPTREANR